MQHFPVDLWAERGGWLALPSFCVSTFHFIFATASFKFFTIFWKLILLFQQSNILIWSFPDMTGSEINHSFLFHGVIKILTVCGMLRIPIARCQIEAEIHSFPTMYIMGGGKYVRNGSNRWFCPKNRPQIKFFSGHLSGSSNFGGVLDPKILKCRHFC